MEAHGVLIDPADLKWSCKKYRVELEKIEAYL